MREGEGERAGMQSAIANRNKGITGTFSRRRLKCTLWLQPALSPLPFLSLTLLFILAHFWAHASCRQAGLELVSYYAPFYARYYSLL